VTEFGRPHVHLRLTESTNDRARELAEAGAPSGTIVTAAEQSAGRGRHGRVWSAPPGRALLLSAILRPLGLEHSLLPLAAPIAVCEAIESLAPVECAIKWPNDVWLDERKVAGVLIEARPPDWAVIGVGVNVDGMRAALCEALGRWVEAPIAEALAEFRARDALSGRDVSWEGAGVEPGSGRAAGVDERGNLLVELADGERLALGSGEISLRPARR
jgi:BirA family biotin operon repressor/biotin-[acetyl-CoA-carboxylase] ligase